MVRLWKLSLGALALVVFAAGAQAAFEDSTPLYTIEDPSGDWAEPCILESTICDYVLFEAGVEGDQFWMRGTVDLLIPVLAEAAYRFEFTDGNGNPQFTMVGVNLNGDRTMTFNGDPEPLAGYEYEVNIDNDSITVWAPLSAVGLTDGGSITFTGVLISYNPVGLAGTGAYLSGMDAIDGLGSLVLEAAAEAAPAATHFSDLGDGVSLIFEQPTNDTYTYNWTSDATDVEFTLDLDLVGGGVTIELLDPDGIEHYAGDHDSALSVAESLSAFIDGQWTLSVTFANFTGTLEADLEAIEIQEAVEEPPTEPLEVENIEPSAGFTIEEEGHALPGPGLLLGGLAVAFLARRQR